MEGNFRLLKNDSGLYRFRTQERKNVHMALLFLPLPFDLKKAVDETRLRAIKNASVRNVGGVTNN